MNKLIKIFNDIILSKSHMTVQYKLSNWDKDLINKDYKYKKKVKEHLVTLIAKEILNSNNIIEEEDIYKLELFVFGPKHFKSIIDSAINHVSWEYIHNVKTDEEEYSGLNNKTQEVL